MEQDRIEFCSDFEVLAKTNGASSIDPPQVFRLTDYVQARRVIAGLRKQMPCRTLVWRACRPLSGQTRFVAARNVCDIGLIHDSPSRQLVERGVRDHGKGADTLVALLPVWRA